MLRMTFLLIAFAAPGLLEQQKNELALDIGGTFTPSRPVANDQPLRFSPALSLGVEYDRRIVRLPIGSLSVGIDFAASPFDVFTSAGLPSAINQYAYSFATPHLRLKLSSIGGLEPWVSGGVGYSNYLEGDFRNGSPNTHTGTTAPAGEVSGGIDYAMPFKLIVPIGLRLGVRDYIAGPPSYNAPVPRSQSNVIVSFGIVLKF